MKHSQSILSYQDPGDELSSKLIGYGVSIFDCRVVKECKTLSICKKIAELRISSMCT